MKTTVIGLVQTVPPILFGPLIGVYLDRQPKKPIMIVTDVLRAVLIGLMLFTTAIAAGALSRWVQVHQYMPSPAKGIDETCAADA